MLTRRQLITAGVSAFAAALPSALLYAWLVEPHWLDITSPELPIRGLPPDLAGKTLAHLSDLHIGPKVSDDYIDRTFARVAQLQPDFVVCTGDWITYRGRRQLDRLERRLAGLPRGRLGTLGILGNHDYGYNWRMEEVAQQVTSIATRAGVTILRNQAATVAGLQFLGLEDLWGPNFAPGSLLERHGGDPATLVLCHNPDAADRPVWGAYQGWILAGHTHGGQCKPPFLPPPVLPVQNRRYTAGAIRVNERRTLYISRGVGHLRRVRFNVRPEVPVFRLRPSE